MSFSQVNGDFTNTGNDIVTISFTDQVGNPVGPLVLRPNQIIRRKFEINFPYFFTYARGRFEESSTHTFTNNATIDVNKYFV